MGFWDFLKGRPSRLPPGLIVHVAERRPDGTIGRVLRIADDGRVFDTGGEAASLSREEMGAVRDLALRSRSEKKDPGRPLWTARFVSADGKELLRVDCPNPIPGAPPSPAWALFAYVLDRIDPAASRRREEELERAQPIRPETLARALDEDAPLSVVYDGGSAYSGFVRLTLSSDGAASVERKPKMFPAPPSNAAPTRVEGRLPSDTLRRALEPLRDPANWTPLVPGPPGSASPRLLITLSVGGTAASRELSFVGALLAMKTLDEAVARVEAQAVELPPPTRVDALCPFCSGSAWKTMLDVPSGVLARCACGAQLARSSSPSELVNLVSPGQSVDALLRGLREGDYHVKVVEISETGGSSRLIYRPWNDGDYAAQAGPCPWCKSAQVHMVRQIRGDWAVYCVCGAAAALFDGSGNALESAAACFEFPLDIGEDALKKAGVLLKASEATPDGRRRRLWCARPSIQPLQTELLAFLRSIESGEIRLACDEDPQRQVTPEYHASNGWTIEVFLDAYTWDYIQSITTSDGRHYDFDALAELPWIYRYAPDEDVEWLRYGLRHDGIPDEARWPGAPS